MSELITWLNAVAIAFYVALLIRIAGQAYQANLCFSVDRHPLFVSACDLVTFGIRVIPEIENAAGVANLDEIVVGSGGAMAARGDRGAEIPLHIALAEQKMMIACAAEGIDAEMRRHAVVNGRGRPDCIEDAVTGARGVDFSPDGASAGDDLATVIVEGDRGAGEVQGQAGAPA